MVFSGGDTCRKGSKDVSYVALRNTAFCKRKEHGSRTFQKEGHMLGVFGNRKEASVL